MRRLLKRRRTRGRGIEELWQREVGELSPRTFVHRVGASEDLVLRLDIHRNLNKHRGCVNTVSFNADGDILISGSDDRMIMLWNWDAGRAKLSFHSGHTNNVFQAKMMPYSDDQSIVTCAADGQVRHALIREGGQVGTENLGKHKGRVHKLAIEPGSPHIFYSCGEDGVVQHFDLRTRTATELFVCRAFDDKSHYMPIVHLNAITIDPRNPNLFSIAGSDEYARLYDIRKCKLDGSMDYGHPTDSFCPQHLIGDDQVGITGLAFSDQRELLVSYNDEQIYLFDRNLGLGPDPVSASQSSRVVTGTGSNLDADADTKSGPQVYKGHRNCDTVKGVNFFGPNCDYIVSGSDCGRVFIWRKKDGELLRVMPGDKHVVNCIERHPHAPILASSGIEHDAKIWMPKATERASLPVNVEEAIDLGFESSNVGGFVIIDYPSASRLVAGDYGPMELGTSTSFAYAEVDLLKCKRRKWLSQFNPGEDVVMHLFPMLRYASGLERAGADRAGNMAFVEYLMGFSDGDDDTSDDTTETSGAPGDLAVN